MVAHTFASSFSETINQFGAVLGIGTLVILALVYLYSTARHGRQDIVRQDNKDLRESNQEMRTQKVGDEATIKEQRESIAHLREIATQTPAVTRLIEANTKMQKQTNEQHAQVITELSNLTGQISHLAGEFSKMVTALNQQFKIDANAKPTRQEKRR